MGALDGKVAVISGGTSGIGARTAEIFVDEGARVVIAGRRRDEGEQLAAALGSAASFIRTDVSVEADVEAMIGHAVARFGRLDCLLNNAGIPSDRAGIAEIELAVFDAAMAVHVRGVLLGMKYAAPVMRRAGAGSIINTASINGLRAGLATLTYSTAKAAVIHLTRCAAVELGEDGIRVNSLSPGPIVTGIFGKGAGMEPTAADQGADLARVALAELLPSVQPLRRIGTAEDVARAALFLASDASGLINGHDLVVDGGLSAGRPFSEMLAARAVFARAFQSVNRAAPSPARSAATEAKEQGTFGYIDATLTTPELNGSMQG
ncbi:MAG: SDR family NAD(P)-dependent oxidoreductase [Dehalococcoidia bacterium]